jgi:hypothetical protein
VADRTGPLKLRQSATQPRFSNTLQKFVDSYQFVITM